MIKGTEEISPRNVQRIPSSPGAGYMESVATTEARKIFWGQSFGVFLCLPKETGHYF